MGSNLSISGQHANHWEQLTFYGMATGQLPRLIRPTDRFVQQIEKKATCGTGKQQPRFENDVVVATIMKNLFRVFLSLCIQCPVDCEYDCYLWMVAWLQH